MNFPPPHMAISPNELQERVQTAVAFHETFLATTRTAHGILKISKPPVWAEKYLRRRASLPEGVLEKISSNSFCKRRPADTLDYLNYITKCYNNQAPLVLRVVIGPVKNALRFGSAQTPDLAEWLMLIQLARLVETIAALYPYGVRVQMVPDDMRGHIANGWPMEYSQRYIRGLQAMARDLQFSWAQVESGQAQLYEQYRVLQFYRMANQSLQNDPDYEQKFAVACQHAQENAVYVETQNEEAVRASATRYLIAHKAELLSGMWSPIDAFPIGYAHHANQFQAFTLGRGVTKLPWQIQLPLKSLANALVAA